MTRRQRAQAKVIAKQQQTVDVALSTLAVTLSAAFLVTMLISAF